MTTADALLINRIAERAERVCLGLYLPYDRGLAVRALTVCHTKYCPMDLARLLDAADDCLLHDVLGAMQSIDQDAHVSTSGWRPIYHQ